MINDDGADGFSGKDVLCLDPWNLSVAKVFISQISAFLFFDVEEDLILPVVDDAVGEMLAPRDVSSAFMTMALFPG